MTEIRPTIHLLFQCIVTYISHLNTYSFAGPEIKTLTQTKI